jgi:hypothetical protein
VPTWVKVAIDAWTCAADVFAGHVFRPVNRASSVTGERLGRKGRLATHQVICRGCRCSRHPAARPSPNLREALSRRWRRAGAGTKQDLVQAPNDAIRLRVG